MEEAEFNSDMLEDGINEMDSDGESEFNAEDGQDIVPDDSGEIPDAQDFETMLDRGAENLAGEDSVGDYEDLGDYEDIGDFDYMDNADIDAADMEEMVDSEFSPDSVGSDVGEIAEEVGEMTEEAESIIAAIL